MSRLDFLVGGMPRSGTTVAAKFFSLHEDVFCYASETHILPFLYDRFAFMPCPARSLKPVLDALRRELTSVLLEMPRFNVSRGAHPGNLVFDEASVADAVEGIAALLRAGCYGRDLIEGAKQVMGRMIRDRVARPVIGEKTPNNVFAMAHFGAESDTLPVVVVRDPIGVVRSMKTRAEDAEDPYNGQFSGEVERNVGLYLKYAAACAAGLRHESSLLIRYDELANDPGGVLTRALGAMGRGPDDRAIAFVENGNDPEVADRAPMRYRRLTIEKGLGNLDEIDYWKVLALTRSVRESLGYGDEAMADLGFRIPEEWPGDTVEAAVLPLAGFGKPVGKSERNIWMSDSGVLVAYLPPGKRRVGLSLWSDLPADLVRSNSASLLVKVGDVVKDAVPVRAGAHKTEIEISLDDGDVVPMGNKGECATISLVAPFSYAPALVHRYSKDTHPVSFLCHGWSIH